MQTSARVLVVDHAVEGAGWDPVHGAEKRPIDPLVQESITQDVDSVASLAWVARSDGAQAERTRSEAVGGCWIVPDGDLVVTLDLIDWDDDAVDLSVSAWGEEFAPDTCGFGWLRSYVVERTAAGWTVTEETVPSGIT
ncbi:MAG: hypothetical protein M3353_00535 [Actinomycetota bacterium]|nr:hypothetical protein [Actinomycetota bacterium]